MGTALHEPGQGTNSKYQQGCRCPECRNAHRIEQRIWRCRQWLRAVRLHLLESEADEMRAEGTASCEDRV